MTVTLRRFLPVLVLPLCLSAQEGDKAKIERGRYLVEEVGKCQDCHTPRDEKGELDRSKWLHGTALGFKPLNPVPGWHEHSPDLTSQSPLWNRWGEKKLIDFMTTGLNPKGKPADPPMPAYRLTKEDAEAVIAYLKSLP